MKEPSVDVDPRKVAEHELGPVDWQEGGTWGYCKCPGAHLHNKPTRHRDCRVYMDGAPRIYCLHSSCSRTLMTAADELRGSVRALCPEGSLPPRSLPTPEELERRRSKNAALAAALSITEDWAKDWSQWRWPLEDLYRSNPRQGATQTDFFREMWSPSDVVWVGEAHHSGPPYYKRWMTADDWAHMPDPLPERFGHFICPSTFQPGAMHRRKEHLLSCPFVIAEADSLSEDPVENLSRNLAAIRFLRDRAGWNLRAVIFSGSKSYHGWFDLPAGGHDHAVPLLKAIGCDPAAARPTQPVRRPGAMRDGVEQKLCWLSHSGKP